MRTLIQGGWVVGHADGQHQVIRDGVCVVEDDRVLHVGKSYDGPLDQTIDARGKLVTPGLISTHEHAAGVGSDYPYLDVGRPESQGRNYLNWMAGLPGRPRYRVDQAVAATFALSQSLRHGTTTVVEIGGGGNPPRMVGIVGELVIRVYKGPMPLNAVAYTHEDGRIGYDWSDERGEQGLRDALAFAERFDGAAGGRVRAILCPGHPDTCTEQLLREFAHQAEQHRLPVTIHAAINPVEVDW